jgi:hypothetical protein
MNARECGACPVDRPARKRAQQAYPGSITKPILVRIEYGHR